MYLYKSLLPTHHEFAEICLSLKLQKSGSKCCSCCKVETTGMADPVPIVRSPPAVNGCPKKTYQVAIRRSVRCFVSVFWPCKKESYTKHWQILEDRVEEKCWVKVPNLMKYWDPSNAFSYWDVLECMKLFICDFWFAICSLCIFDNLEILKQISTHVHIV